MGLPNIQNTKFNDVVYTPSEIVESMIDWVEPKGLILDGWKGGGAFYNQLKVLEDVDDDNFEVEWCEIEEGKDFMLYNRKVDYIISNPPFSKLSATIKHCLEIADNTILLIPLHKVFMSPVVIRLIKEYNVSIRIKSYKVPKHWSQNFEIGAVWFKKNTKSFIE